MLNNIYFVLFKSPVIYKKHLHLEPFK